MEGICYTLKELIALNNGNCNDTSDQVEFFKSFPVPKASYEKYNNTHNVLLKDLGKTKKTYVKQAAIYSDDRIVDDVKRIVNSITADRVNQPISELSRLSVPKGQELAIAKVFHQSMIRCNSLIDRYLDLLLKFRNRNLEYAVLKHFINLLINEFLHPHVFKDADSDVELGIAKTKRWRVSNTTIMVKLAVRINRKHRFYKYRGGLDIVTVSKRVIGTLVINASKYNKIDIDTLIEVWPMVKDYIPVQHYDAYINRMKKLSADSKLNKIVQTKLMSVLPIDSDNEPDDEYDSDLDVLALFQ